MPSVFVPVLSPEHGAYVVLSASFLIGIVNAGQWNVASAIALVSVFAGFEAQFPMMQMLRRRAIVARLLVWGMIYSALAAVAALWLIEQAPALIRIVWVVLGLFASAAVLGAARKYQALVQELVAFAGLPLAAPWAETATHGVMPAHAVGIWILLTLAFWGAIFAVRIRSRGPRERAMTAAYSLGALALAIILACVRLVSWKGLWLLAPSYAWLGVVLFRPGWWRSLTIQKVGAIETCGALAMVPSSYDRACGRPDGKANTYSDFPSDVVAARLPGRGRR